MKTMKSAPETNLATTLAEFSDVTQFHGILELYHSKTLSGKIFWTTIVILGFVVSFYSIYNDYSMFQQRPTATIIKPLDAGDKIYVPNFMFCYTSWMYWVDFQRLKTRNISKPALLASLTFLGDVISETEFDPAAAKQEFLAFMSDYNMTKIDIIKNQNMIMLCYTTESATLIRSLFPAKKDLDVPLLSKRDNDILTRKLNFSIKPIIYEDVSDFVTKTEYNIYVSRWLALQTNFILSKDEDYRKDYSQFSLPLLIFPNGDDLTKNSKFDRSIESFTITFSATSHDRLSNRQTGCDVKRIPTDKDKSCPEKCSILYQEVDPSCLEINKAAIISADSPRNLCSYRFIFIPKIADFSKLPHWTTSVVPFLEKKRPADSLLGLSDGQQLVERKYLKSKCEKNCSKPCVEWRYSYTLIKFFYDRAGELNHSDLRIWLVYPRAKALMVYQDIYIKNYFNILGDVGGILGIWIGGSVITIIQSLYIFIFKPFCDCETMHNDVSEADDSEENDQHHRALKKKRRPKVKVSFKGDRIVAIRSID